MSRRRRYNQFNDTRRHTWASLNAPSFFEKLTRPYRPRYNFRSIRPGTQVKWIEKNPDVPGTYITLTGQVWSRAPKGGEWWIVTPDGKAHKLHWKKFSPQRGPG